MINSDTLEMFIPCSHSSDINEYFRNSYIGIGCKMYQIAKKEDFENCAFEGLNQEYIDERKEGEWVFATQGINLEILKKYENQIKISHELINYMFNKRAGKWYRRKNIIFNYIEENYGEKAIKSLENKNDESIFFFVHYLVGESNVILSDGPSAGLSIFFLFFLLIIEEGEQLNRKGICFSGELNKKGELIWIGGLKEKIIHSIVNYYRVMIIPKLNKEPLKELEREPEFKIETPESKRKKITDRYVCKWKKRKLVIYLANDVKDAIKKFYEATREEEKEREEEEEREKNLKKRETREGISEEEINKIREIEKQEKQEDKTIEEKWSNTRNAIHFFKSNNTTILIILFFLITFFQFIFLIKLIKVTKDTKNSKKK